LHAERENAGARGLEATPAKRTLLYRVKKRLFRAAQRPGGSLEKAGRYVRELACRAGLPDLASRG
jgi:hypothetical protein